MSVVPNDIRSLVALQHLYLCRNPISTLPESMRNLARLKSLYLEYCDRLQSIPELLTSLHVLILRNCSSLERIRNLPNMLTSLHVILQGCKNLVEVQGLLKLEQIRSTHKEMIVNLKLFNSKSSETKRSHSISLTTGPLVCWGTPIQVLSDFFFFYLSFFVLAFNCIVRMVQVLH